MNKSHTRCVLTTVVVIALVGSACGQGLRVYTIDLLGNPLPNIDVRVADQGRIYPEERNLSNDNGLAVLPIGPRLAQDSMQVRVNLEQSIMSRPTSTSDLIGRAKHVTWNSRQAFNDGFAIPLWTHGDVNSLADAVVVNPTHYAVAIQFKRADDEPARIIAKSAGDTELWTPFGGLELPTVRSPRLARELYREFETGHIIPPRFDRDLQRVAAEVQRQNEQTRICRLRPLAEQADLPPALGGAPSTPPYPTPPNPVDPSPPAIDPSPPVIDPSPPVIPQPSIGNVVIHNQGPCEFGLTVNAQRIVVRRGMAIVPTRLGPVTTSLAGPFPVRQAWNHWQFNGQSYRLTLYAHSRLVQTPTRNRLKFVPRQTLAVAEHSRQRSAIRFHPAPEISPRCQVVLSPYPQPPADWTNIGAALTGTPIPADQGSNGPFMSLLESLFAPPAPQQPWPAMQQTTATAPIQSPPPTILKQPQVIYPY